MATDKLEFAELERLKAASISKMMNSLRQGKLRKLSEHKSAEA